MDGALALARNLLDGRARLEALIDLLPLFSPAYRLEIWPEILGLIAAGPAGRRVVAERLSPLLDALGVDTVLELVHSFGWDRPTLIHLAERVPEKRAELAHELLEGTRDDSLISSDALFALAPLAEAMAPAEATQLYLRLCRCLLDTNSRAELLWTWTRDDLTRLGPLLRRIGGEPAVLAVAEQIVAVAVWMP